MCTCIYFSFPYNVKSYGLILELFVKFYLRDSYTLVCALSWSAHKQMYWITIHISMYRYLAKNVHAWQYGRRYYAIFFYSKAWRMNTYCINISVDCRQRSHCLSIRLQFVSPPCILKLLIITYLNVGTFCVRQRYIFVNAPLFGAQRAPLSTYASFNLHLSQHAPLSTCTCLNMHLSQHAPLSTCSFSTCTSLNMHLSQHAPLSTCTSLNMHLSTCTSLNMQRGGWVDDS